MAKEGVERGKGMEDGGGRNGMEGGREMRRELEGEVCRNNGGGGREKGGMESGSGRDNRWRWQLGRGRVREELN